MSKFLIEVTQTDHAYVEVEADSRTEAKAKAAQSYLDQSVEWYNGTVGFSIRPDKENNND